MVQAVTLPILDELVGTRVIVCWSSVPLSRNGFHAQINVSGILEQCSSPADEDFCVYRVLLPSNGETGNKVTSYAYLNAENVEGVIGPIKSGEQVIYIR